MLRILLYLLDFACLCTLSYRNRQYWTNDNTDTTKTEKHKEKDRFLPFFFFFDSRSLIKEHSPNFMEIIKSIRGSVLKSKLTFVINRRILILTEGYTNPCVVPDKKDHFPWTIRSSSPTSNLKKKRDISNFVLY